MRGAPGALPENVVAIGTLDAIHQLDAPVTVVDTPHASDPLRSAENPRLVVHQSRLFLVYNPADSHSPMGPRTLHLARVGVDSRGAAGKFDLEDDRRLYFVSPDGRLPRISKNWSPFVADGQLHFIFSSSPLQVLRVANADLFNAAPMAKTTAPA